MNRKCNNSGFLLSVAKFKKKHEKGKKLNTIAC